MFLVFILKVFGWLAASLPESFVQGLCNVAGDIIYFTLTGRRRAMLSNLHHAFPDKPAAWHRRIGRESCRRMVEMGLYVAASPWFDEKRIRQMLVIPSETRDLIERLRNTTHGGILMCPHFTLTETLIHFPFLYPNTPEFGAIFRPFDNPYLDRWVKKTRERHGIKLLSRRNGINEAKRIIRDGGWVGVLFDQNAGRPGGLINFFNRVASATDLPCLLANKFDCPLLAVATRRTGFWRAELHLHVLECSHDRTGPILAAHRWLEDQLRSSDGVCADWLWMHKRWKTQSEPDQRLRLEQKRDFLEESRQFLSIEEQPRSTRFWIRLPNWLGDVVMALPLIRAIRNGRPDAEITLICQPAFIPLLEKLHLAEKLIPLPSKKDRFAYFQFFRAMKDQYPDTFILLTNSSRGDLEAWLTQCPQRFGMVRPGKWRPLLTHAWKLPPDLDESGIHQTRVWEKFLIHFGLREPLDLQPLEQPEEKSEAFRIGLICGTENMPEKRWPVKHWRTLIEQMAAHYPKARFLLFGTANDRTITQTVADGFPPEQVQDLAGQTNLIQFIDQLKQCRLLVCNDTGGMHLANAFGVPVIALFGPTNPTRTGPLYDAPVTVLQPPGCPPAGGLPIDQITPETVVSTVEEFLNSA